ncbi:MAG: glycosyltransferase [Pseudomonadota bacterium]
MIVVANTPEEDTFLQEFGLETLLANQNQFSDPNTFQPIRDLAQRPFDAIYNARFLPYKRHDLAEAVPRLSLLGYSFDTPEFARIKAKFTDAHFANDVDGEFRRLSHVDVNDALNQARVGLCLSETEGAMAAAVEYLLAGLPVVTTPSEGGRDVFFDDRFVRVAAPDPDAVAHAVQSLCDEKISPAFIREETLKKIDAANQTFFDDLSQIVGVSSEEIGRLFRERLSHQLVSHTHRDNLFES